MRQLFNNVQINLRPLIGSIVKRRYNLINVNHKYNYTLKNLYKFETIKIIINIFLTLLLARELIVRACLKI